MPRKNKKKAKRKKAKKRSGGYNRGGGFRGVTGLQNNPNHRGGYRGGPQEVRPVIIYILFMFVIINNNISYLDDEFVTCPGDRGHAQRDREGIGSGCGGYGGCPGEAGHEQKEGERERNIIKEREKEKGGYGRGGAVGRGGKVVLIWVMIRNGNMRKERK